MQLGIKLHLLEEMESIYSYEHNVKVYLETKTFSY